LIAMLVACSVVAAALFFPSRKQGGKMPEQKNPAELKAAFTFGALYALVLLAVASAKDHFGSAGLYIVAIISGLTDVDAITLSSAQLAASNSIDAGTAWQIILIAIMANLLFKFGVVAMLGPASLTKWVGGAFALVLIVGAALLLLWPVDEQGESPS
ncbi:MAG TPA: DUF4010 domain-containing protein, partial [Terrimicrobiaceae bacterium]